MEAVLDRVALTLDERSCPEGAELDSPGQRPGTKADAAPHKAQRAVTPGDASHGPLGLWDRIMRTRSPRPAAWAIGFGPFGAVARAGFPPTQRRPIANLARGKVRAFGPLKVAASGTKTPPQNRRSFPNHRRGLKGNAPGERGMSRVFSVGPTGQPFAGRTVCPLDRCTVTTVLRSPGRCPELGELGECASLSGQPSLRRHGAGGGGEMLEQGRLSGQPSLRRHGAGGGGETLSAGPAVAWGA